MTDYESMRENAQGRPHPCLPKIPFPLVGFDVIVAPGGALEVLDLTVRNARTDAYGVRVEFDFLNGKKWVEAGVSWLDMGAQENKALTQDSIQKISKRIWCHEDYRVENIAAVKAQMVTHVMEKIEKLQGLLEILEPPATHRPRPGG